jgi:hypothetical protein
MLIDADREMTVNPLGKREGLSLRSLQLGLPLVAALGFEMGIREEKAYDLK